MNRSTRNHRCQLLLITRQPAQLRDATAQYARPRRVSARHGLTLIEVLLSASILVMVMAALSHLQDSAVKAATRAEIESEAIVVCQTELDRILAQPSGLTDSVEVVSSAPEWTRRIQLTPTSVSGLTCLTVELLRTSQLQRPTMRPAATLSRWIAAPNPSVQTVTTGGRP